STVRSSSVGCWSSACSGCWASLSVIVAPMRDRRPPRAGQCASDVVFNPRAGEVSELLVPGGEDRLRVDTVSRLAGFAVLGLPLLHIGGRGVGVTAADGYGHATAVVVIARAPAGRGLGRVHVASSGEHPAERTSVRR